MSKKSLISLITLCVILSLSFNQNDNVNSGNLFIASSEKLDGNNISAWFRNNGSFNRNPSTDNSGFIWPNGSNKILRYASGLWLGAKVANDTLVAVATYGYEYLPGYIDISGNPQGKDDPQYKVYKIIKDDSLSSDYLNWPVSQGAYNGENGKPFLPGTQTIFYSMTDGYPESHWNNGGSTAPMKAQVQVTSWCYNDYPPTELRNVIFSEFKIINKNNLPWNEAFITIWSDECSDEQVAIGCDSILNLGYSYCNPNSFQYGSNPPAMAFLLLKGPEVYTGNPNDTVYSFVPGQSQRTVKIGYKELKLGTFNMYQNSTAPYEPDTYQETYLTMHGYKSDGTSWINPLNNSVTKFPFSGDPESGTGWNQFATNGYGNRRLQMNIGELNLNPGDTQTIVVAQIVSQGTSNLNSVTKLKQSAVYVKDVFNNNFTTVGIKENVTSGIISDYKLYQNYPNPFNPTTKINYELKITNYVSVIVYDILGNEVSKLVNQKQNAGSFEVEFSGNNLPSGIYFYTLSVDGNPVDTKRMILLK